MIELQHVSAGYGAQDVVRDVSFAAPNGQLTALIGPNGSGKTTLLRAMTRTLPCRSGNILLDDRSIASYGRKEFARTAAFMPQSRPVPGITVRALVAHGRFPYLGFSRRMTAQDTAAVEQAMRRTGTLDWANRDVRALSGGERQRVYLAMALAQGGTTILLDEPGAFLDVRAQFELLDLLRSVAAGGKAVVLVMHELPQAMQYADRIALLVRWSAEKRESPVGGHIARPPPHRSNHNTHNPIQTKSTAKASGRPRYCLLPVRWIMFGDTSAALADAEKRESPRCPPWIAQS